ncbi:hemolysin family protein [Desulfococcaceae bacterium OttesenSCG-928-F15]|nr:hemolysin family protein [Desulfococcaceae bacterium OttesenSCG-928-F15]
MEIFILVGLILLNGLFAMAEIALVTAQKNRLESRAQEGDRAAYLAMQLRSDPTQFLSTIQIGITAIGILCGIVGDTILGEPLNLWLQHFGIPARYSVLLGTFIAFVGITYFTIVIGELIPKRLAQNNAETVARIMARPIAFLAKLSRPIVFILSFSTDSILRLFGRSGQNRSKVTEDDIFALLMEGSKAGAIEDEELELVRKVFNLQDRQAASLMTPRSEIDYIDISKPFERNLEKILASHHSRLPVCNGGLENTLGFFSSRTAIRQVLKNGNLNINDGLRPLIYLPENLTGIRVLEEFRDASVRLGLVVDEYGDILGLITLQDLLEALIGEFKKPRHPHDMWSQEQDDGSWLLNGLAPIAELKELLGLKTIPEEEKGRYHTLSGMVLWLVGRLPHRGDIVYWEDWRFEVLTTGGNRVEQVLAKRIDSVSLIPFAGEPVDEKSGKKGLFDGMNTEESESVFWKKKRK